MTTENSRADALTDLPPMPENAGHVMRRIRRCEAEAAAQVVLEHFAIQYATIAIARSASQPAAAPISGAAWMPATEDERATFEAFCEHYVDPADDVNRDWLFFIVGHWSSWLTRAVAAPAPADERAACIAWATANGFTKYHESMCAAWEERARRAASASETGAGEAIWYERWQAECSADYGEYDENSPIADRLRWWVPKSARHGTIQIEDDLREAADALSRSPAMAAEAVAVPAEVVAWRDAWQAYVDATDTYNAHLKYVRENCPLGTSVDVQYQAMNDAQRVAMALLKPMHAVLSGAIAAPQPAQADARPLDDELWDQAMRERDEYHEMADKLAAAIAAHFGADIGEHSNANCPWEEALEVIENAMQADAREGLTDGPLEAAKAVMREALDAVSVHPCDEHDDEVRARQLPDHMQRLYRALLAAHSGQPEPRGEVTDKGDAE